MEKRGTHPPIDVSPGSCLAGTVEMCQNLYNIDSNALSGTGELA